MVDYQQKQLKRMLESYHELDNKHRLALLDEIKYQGILAAGEEVAKTQTVTFESLLPAVRQRQKYFNKYEGFTSGLAYFDDATMGLRGGELIIIAGPSNYGKTMVALNLAVRTILTTQKTALIISMEMPAADIAQRMYNMADEDDYPILGKRLIIQTELAVNTHHVAAMVERHKPDFLVVDHLQFLANQQPSPKEYERIVQAVAGLKQLAMIYHLPVIAISHVAKTRSGKNGKASAADLYGSARIEQDCDIGILVGRPDDDIHGDTILLTLFKNRNKKPFVFHKECALLLEGVRIGAGGRYTEYGSVGPPPLNIPKHWA